MALRSARERFLQSAGFEVGGLMIAAPLYSLFFGASSGHSFLLLISLSIAVLIWAPLHNIGFDMMDLHVFDRLASDRPHGWRIFHACSLEITSIALTFPMVMAITGHGVLQSLAVNVGLTLFYVVYGYFYHLAFDRLRPVKDHNRISAGPTAGQDDTPGVDQPSALASGTQPQKPYTHTPDLLAAE